MLKTLRPRAVNPPSANKKACISKTTVRAKVAAQGPTKTAARTAPSKWPLVPAATGKLSICTAKIKTAVKPASGAVFSSSCERAPFKAAATPTAEMPAKIADV